jgi:UDP-N-acetylmuramyl pentapeptide phosphotransferase/UDP-N-acetylglucosamine-1-phosphate transferase
MTDIANIVNTLIVFGPVALFAGLLTAGLIVLLMPWLRAYALARPNARSSHSVPTPQGGGAAVIIATLATVWGAAALLDMFPQGVSGEFLALTGAALLLAVVGAIDDIRRLSPGLRLLLQAIAVGALIAMLPVDLRAVPMLPWWLERVGLFVGFMWFVNLTNFMDGIDWLTVAEAVPITGAIILLGLLNIVSALPALTGFALLGAILGFAPFNKPVAKVFLGDVGSLSIGLLLAWLLLRLAGSDYPAAAIILPLYYLADATLTLCRRLVAGEAVWQAHHSHFYQRALDRGFTVSEVVGRVFVVNLALMALAAMTVIYDSYTVSLTAFAIGVLLVAWLLVIFAQGKS